MKKLLKGSCNDASKFFRPKQSLDFIVLIVVFRTIRCFANHDVAL